MKRLNSVCAHVKKAFCYIVESFMNGFPILTFLSYLKETGKGLVQKGLSKSFFRYDHSCIFEFHWLLSISRFPVLKFFFEIFIQISKLKIK
ncbi:hypothetical protein KUTeg_009811 [Tegillarca granosa]|uniref:Uncharacterized protein n=1 Tax=Tegillarca granosa TaxID=220873 RepID=A0ABQ9F4Y5_TEGGR|nr:hypothetical protein KUTeg_009811 [Tegillarca granosa]